MKKSLLFLAAVLLLILNVTAEPTGISTPTYNETEGFYEIGNWEDLLWISQNPEHWDKDYVQTANIDFGDADPPIGEWNDSKGWSPIGKFEAGNEKPFTGTYDGGGNTIENLVIDREEEEEVVGLFGFAKNAEITNIQLEDVFIKGDEGVGGITGVAEYTQIFNCSVSGIIDGCDYVGGIAGAMLDGEIHKSYNEANIVGIEAVGGIVGCLFQEGLVNDSYNLGEITGFGVGGLVGVGVGEVIEDSSEPEKSFFSITNSYSAGIINLTDQPSTKALEPAKKPLNSIIPRHNLRDQFPKEDPAGGVIGYLELNGEIITNCFFDKEAVNLDEPIWDDQAIDGITGKTTAEMKDINTFSDWDISPDPDIPADYPFLAWENDSSKSPVWIIGTSTAAVPLSNTALYLSLALIGGFVFFRIYRIS